MDLAQLRSASTPLVVAVDGGEIRIGFRAAVYTPRFLDELGELTLPQALCRLLTSWDLMDDGEPVPLEEAALEEVPMTMLRAILRAVQEAIFPNPNRAGSTESS